jgi:hypothetical protein
MSVKLAFDVNVMNVVILFFLTCWYVKTKV